MTDSNEPFEERVKRLESEAAELRRQLADETRQREELLDRYRSVLGDFTRRAWEGFSQEELDAAIASPVTLQSFIDELEREANRG